MEGAAFTSTQSLRLRAQKILTTSTATLLAQAVEGYRGHEYGVLEKFAGRGMFSGKSRIDHQRVGFAARPVIIQYVFFGDLERALGQAALSDGGFVPGLVRLPADHEIPGEMPLLLRFDVSIQSARNRHATLPR